MIFSMPSQTIAFALVLLFGSPVQSPRYAPSRLPDTGGAALIRSAFERYNSTWYRTLTFVQQTIRYRADGSTDTAVWYEAYQAPGKLRIDVAPLADRTMYLFADDSQYVYRRDSLVAKQSLIHPLLLLGFDLYFQAPELTIGKLKTLGYDLSVVHNDYWQGRPAVVVGALAGDTTSPQFWIDAEHLLFVRSISPLESGGMQEVRFNGYRQLEGGWIAPEVVFLIKGRVVMKELYDEIRSGVEFDDAFFDPMRWRIARHWCETP